MYKTGTICQGELKMLYKAEWTEFGSLGWQGVKKSFVLCLLAIPWTHRLSWFCFYWHFRCFQISHVFKYGLSTPVSILCIVCLYILFIFILSLYFASLVLSYQPLKSFCFLTCHFVLHVDPLSQIQDNEAAVYWSRAVGCPGPISGPTTDLLGSKVQQTVSQTSCWCLFCTNLDAFLNSSDKRPLKNTQQCFLHTDSLQFEEQLWKKLMTHTHKLNFCPH